MSLSVSGASTTDVNDALQTQDYSHASFYNEVVDERRNKEDELPGAP